MRPDIRKFSRIARSSAVGAFSATAALLFIFASCQRPDPGTFATPEEAVQALHDLIGTGDDRRTEEIFGPGSLDVFRSGDATDDRRAADRVKALIGEKVAFEEIDDHTKVALLGPKAWPFPIPLVLAAERWHFDTASGREELLNRRIGYNELATLSSLHEFVDAQLEYAAQGRDGNPPAFARRFISSEGKQDGLYWPAAESDPASPLGDLFAQASRSEADAAEPFHGYHFRILEGQGAGAPGGEKSYIDGNGRMTGGFAAIAWPAKYGNSGVKSFIVSRRGMVFEKDLGQETPQAAAAIVTFDPDSTWDPTGDSLEQAEGDNADETPASTGKENE